MSGHTHDPQSWSAGVKTHAAAKGEKVIPATQRGFITGVIFSASGTIAAAVKATLVWKRSGVTETLGVLIGTTLGRPIYLDFSKDPLEADPDSTMTANIPDLGVAGKGETVLLGWLEEI